VLFLGIKVNGMRGWFDLGFAYFQPSELSKPIFILTLCAITKISKTDIKLFFNLTGITLLWCIPLALQPDFGTLIVYLAGFFIVYILAGGKFLYLLPGLALLIPTALYIYTSTPYITARIAGFLNPEKTITGAGWHILQFQYTMARGGFSGQSWGKSLWANSYLPLSYSDSAFASMVEAIGFIGTIPVILGFCILAYAGYRLSLHAKNDINKIFICAMPIVISIQAMIHISVNVTMFPATGITLPLFSYGGSSLISIMLSFGIILSATKKS
jgi:cell division protein FtsW